VRSVRVPPLDRRGSDRAAALRGRARSAASTRSCTSATHAVFRGDDAVASRAAVLLAGIGERAHALPPFDSTADGVLSERARRRAGARRAPISSSSPRAARAAARPAPACAASRARRASRARAASSARCGACDRATGLPASRFYAALGRGSAIAAAMRELRTPCARASRTRTTGRRSSCSRRADISNASRFFDALSVHRGGLGQLHEA
jgi:hypothetical protein